MIREQIRKDLIKTINNLPAAAKALAGRHLTIDQSLIEVVRTQNAQFGDYNSNIALKISSRYSSRKRKRVEKFIEKESSRQAPPKAGQARTIKEFKHSPMEFARLLSDSLQNLPYIKKLEVKEPGFINFFVKDEVWQKEVSNVLKAGSKYGSNQKGKGKKARVEFVSANPTGPLHFGNARGGPIGDDLASVLLFSGWKVLREYIDNDRGNQVTELGKTLASKANLIVVKGETLTYQGEYTKEVAAIVKKIIGKTSKLSDEEVIAKAGEIGVKILFDEIIADCAAMGISYDLIVHESDLQKQASKVLWELEKKGLLKKKEGATWFAPRLRSGQALRQNSGQAPRNEFLKDRDAVVVKSDGSYTYFTADVVYHKEKFESGFDLVVDVFGSNTIGHVPKLKALAQVLSFDLEKFKVILYQFVRVKRGGEVVKMSKRAGNFITVREVLDEVGQDALRFFILMHDANTHMDFDLELAKERSAKNPVYYVQYAHARIASILKKASNTPGVKLDAALPTPGVSKGIEDEPGLNISSKPGSGKADYQLLTTNYELALIKQITRLPELVEDIAASFAVHQLTAYAIDLADSFHKFYENCPVLTAGEDLRSARLALCRATQIALANTLMLLGVSAPAKM